MVKSKKQTSKKIEDAPSAEAEEMKTLAEVDVKESEETNKENGVAEVTSKKKPTGKAKEKEQKPQTEPARKSARAPKPVMKEGDPDESYEVEALVQFRLNRGKPQYLVRWKGYSRGDDTWEDEKDLNCPELLQKFKEENPNAGKKPQKRVASKSPAPNKVKAKKAEEDYEVEEIVGVRIKNGKREFKIRWKGYKESDDSWEPEKQLSCQDLIDKYLEEHGDELKAEEKKTPVKKAKTPTKSAKGKKTKSK